jgi:hypothetical protein
MESSEVIDIKMIIDKIQAMKDSRRIVSDGIMGDATTDKVAEVGAHSVLA